MKRFVKINEETWIMLASISKVEIRKDKSGCYAIFIQDKENPDSKIISNYFGSYSECELWLETLLNREEK